MYYTERYDGELGAIPFYQRYPEYMPFVGSHYGENGPKILLVAESHYLPKNSTIHLNPETWYRGSSTDLTQEERKWINTRGVVSSGKNQRWKHKGHAIYRNLEQALIEAGYPECDNTFRFVASMNGFPRPAKEKTSLKVSKLDTSNALEVLNDVIDVISPDHICFVSKKAWSSVGRRLCQPVDFVPHPACAWWHRASRKGTGKQQFMDKLQRYNSGRITN